MSVAVLIIIEAAFLAGTAFGDIIDHLDAHKRPAGLGRVRGFTLSVPPPLTQTTVPHRAAPQGAILTFVSPDWLSHVPTGSAAWPGVLPNAVVNARNGGDIAIRGFIFFFSFALCGLVVLPEGAEAYRISW
jgi:hypothetical protein